MLPRPCQSLKNQKGKLSNEPTPSKESAYEGRPVSPIISIEATSQNKYVAYLMESTTNVQRLPVLLTTGDRAVGDVLALSQDPGDRSARAVLVILLRARLGLMQPVLECPHLCLFLQWL